MDHRRKEKCTEYIGEVRQLRNHPGEECMHGLHQKKPRGPQRPNWTAVKFFVKNEISRRSRKISKWHAYLRIFLAGGVWCMVTLIYDDPPSLLIWICCPGPPCNGNFLRSLPCLAFFSLRLIILWQDTAFLLISEHCLFVNVSEVYSSNKPGGLPPFLPCPNPKSHQSPLPHKKITVPYKPLVNR